MRFRKVAGVKPLSGLARFLFIVVRGLQSKPVIRRSRQLHQPRRKCHPHPC